MKIAICDDLKAERDVLRETLNQLISNIVITEYEDGNELVSDHRDNRFNMIFLDIIMPCINGIEVAEKIREFDKDTPIVFITTSEEFAVRSYRVLAFDYLLKPLDNQRVGDCLKRFINSKIDTRSIVVNYDGVDTKIRISNIIYIESYLRKVIFHMVEDKTIEITAKLADFEYITKEFQFCRCHKSYIINVSHINNIVGYEYIMTSGDKIRISRNYLSQAKKAYFDYVFGGGSSV